MAKKIRLTRLELKRFRDALERFGHYLPILKLKQQQLQIALRDISEKRHSLSASLLEAQNKFEAYRAIMADTAGIDVTGLAEPEEVKLSTTNIAGVRLPLLEKLIFPKAHYSLFATASWVDSALKDLRRINERQKELDIIEQQYDLLFKEYTKISQRVNLFEQVKIPEAREAIRLIRIKLGDEMTAAVGRAKIAKAKIAEGERYAPETTDDQQGSLVS